MSTGSALTTKRDPETGRITVRSEGFFIGADFGKRQDYSAVILEEKVRLIDQLDGRGQPEVRYYVRDGWRYPLETDYEAIVDDIVGHLDNRALWTEGRALSGQTYCEKPKLVMDAGGPGEAIYESFLRKGNERRSLYLLGITGATSEGRVGNKFTAGRGSILHQLQVDAQMGILKIASGIAILTTLQQELHNIQPRHSENPGLLTYEQKRQSVHDDVAMAAATCHWLARRKGASQGYSF